MTKAEEELQEAEDDIAEYESYVNDGSYKSYFKVDEYQAIYDENLKPDGQDGRMGCQLVAGHRRWRLGTDRWRSRR